MPTTADLSGNIYGYLTVIKLATKIEEPLSKKNRSSRWCCRCICGKEIQVSRNSLVTGNTKSCGCKTIEMRVHKNTKHGLSAIKKNDGRRTAEYDMFITAKYRARKRGLEFTITLNDIIIPTHCPVLGIPLSRGLKKSQHASPSLDRIDNAKGYTPDNICLMSRRANCLKNDASAEELEAIAKWLRSKQLAK